MNARTRKYSSLLLLWCICMQCRKPYEPAVLTAANNYLVVDGFINTSPGGITRILLSRTKNLTDTVVNIPETNAQVSIESVAGTAYNLQDNGDGTYASTALSLAGNTTYRVHITTSNGRQYQSDYVSPVQTPAIDSVNWQQADGVSVYVNTHDPANKTHFYRWRYTETWEYHSQLETIWGVSNGLIYLLSPEQQVHVCYNTTLSTGVLLGNSTALGQDVISGKLLTTIPANDSTLQYRMSILVEQYALTAAAFSYWQIIQKNSEDLGTLFDLQPSQLSGNIHSLSDATEPVVGFISANTLQQQRIFINNADLQNWQPAAGTYNCNLRNVPVNASNYLILDDPDTTYGPYYYISMGPLVLSKKTCLDCTLSGGTNVKPSFW